MCRRNIARRWNHTGIRDCGKGWIRVLSGLISISAPYLLFVSVFFFFQFVYFMNLLKNALWDTLLCELCSLCGFISPFHAIVHDALDLVALQMYFCAHI